MTGPRDDYDTLYPEDVDDPGFDDAQYWWDERCTPDDDDEDEDE